MKKLILAVLFLISSRSYSTEWEKTCTEMSEVAKVIMEIRQNGGNIADTMAMAHKSTDKHFNAKLEDFVIEAYDSPRFSSKEYQQRAAQDFQNEIYLSCAKALRDKNN